MTTTTTAAAASRFRLARAGILNVWQYDDQVFDFADGRLLLRGANGAGKSKTLELLLPFALDGDSAAMESSGRRGNQLVWLMTDGIDADTRTGYVWVEVSRPTDSAAGLGTGRETFTCGVGIRASTGARSADRWFFVCDRPVGDGWTLEEAGTPLSRDRLRDVLAGTGTVFTRAGEYREHVGRRLFGLDPPAYDDLLRLLYWLRRPQVGEDVEPGRLSEALRGSLPAIDEDAVRDVGVALDDLAAFGQQVMQVRQQVEALRAFVEVYARYARAVVRDRAQAVVDADTDLRGRQRDVERVRRDHERASGDLQSAQEAGRQAGVRRAEAEARLGELERSPEARHRTRIRELERLADASRAAEVRAVRAASEARRRQELAAAAANREASEVMSEAAAVLDRVSGLVRDAARFPPTALDGGATPTAPGAVEPDPASVSHWAAVAVEVAEAVAVVSRRWRSLLEALLAALADLAATVVASRAADADLAREETVAEEAEGHLRDAERDATAVEGAFVGDVAAWLDTAPPAGPGDGPGVDVAGLRGLLATDPERWISDGDALARDAAAAALHAAQQSRAAAAHAAAAAQADLVRLGEDRARVEAETDPAPPAPALPRDSRDGRPGAPLWRLVDVAPHLDEGARAAVEAALQASGLLDAWVTPQGSPLPHGTSDTGLVVGAAVAVTGSSLADVLVPDVTATGAVPAEVVARLLRQVPLHLPADVATEAILDGPAATVGVDGSFRLGPLSGAARKPAGQYLGASARQAERARRLAAIDADAADRRDARERHRAEEAAAHAAVGAWESWTAAVPDRHGVLGARVRVSERATARDRASGRVTTAEARAGAARAALSSARDTAEQRAGAAGSTPDLDLASATRDEARQIESHARETADAARRLVPATRRWAGRAEDEAQARDQAAAADAEADVLVADAAATAAEAVAAREALGASVEELERRISETHHARAAAQSDARTADITEKAALVARATAGQAISAGEIRLGEAGAAVDAAVGALRAAVLVPGVVSLAIGRPPTPDEAAALAAVPTITLLRKLLGTMDATGVGGPGAGRTDVLAAHRTLQAGPAADLDPQLSGDDVLAAAVVDPAIRQARDIPGVLADLAETAERNRHLLTEREQRIFEQHLLGELGESLRSRRLDADDLVRRTNVLLGGVSTSQGIRVRLRWALTDEAGPEVRVAADLLTRPIGALLPEESSRLRGALSRLIDASRQEDPELPYADHLARALDYRTWSRFTVEIHRPGAASWQPLTRRTPLSQGEQKVVCYLPLFAAAAAHFESVAGAAPHAPRFVLLDDAFPKIDARTHPLLMGLLVQLDLDFVITSERLWGTFPEVPSLAIYEALRAPDEPGIAQLEFRWNGRRLEPGA